MSNYEVIKVIGQGSMSTVHKARRREDDEIVAIKQVRTDDEELLNVTQREFDLLRELQHPRIIRAYECFQTKGGIVLVMEYFDGENLAQAVSDAPCRRFHEETAWPLYWKLLEAVAFLHQCGIVHRDVKPDNVLVSNGLDDLRLADFNTANRTSDSGDMTMTGTWVYAAPEVIHGQSPGVSNDVWAVGLCFYFMLSGKLPQKRHRIYSVEELAKTVSDRVCVEGGDGERSLEGAGMS